ncbi:hypothetical protein [Brevibacillus reuszeri]|uniref:hypothetical protein n=1 Tax=Brevibacillus reuszeri TaxID=54915 RepID=UPI000CCC790D|nr:hypothetical protein [Brevibacillus reuszeri]
MSEETFWQLTEFADKLEVHYTTVNTYFKNLEKQKIHYVNRLESGHKIYDSLDLKIGYQILEMKQKGWTLSAIYNFLKDTPPFELRPFPDEYPSTGNELTTEIILAELQTGFKKEMQNMLNEQTQKIREEILGEKLILLERSESDRLAARQQEITDRITNNRVRLELEIEALEEWSKKDPSERLMKVGLFRKEEDILKRDLFVKKYVSERIEERLKNEMGGSAE